MTISELSSRTGVPVATIKYYVREGLLPPGERPRANASHYGDAHVERLRLVRALREVGGLGVAAIRDVLSAMREDPAGSRRYLGIAMDALSAPASVEPADPALAAVEAEVRAFIDALGWRSAAHPRPAAEMDLARALLTIRRVIGDRVTTDWLLPYAHIMSELARAELAGARTYDVPPEESVKRAVVGTVLFEPVMVALRRLALMSPATLEPR